MNDATEKEILCLLLLGKLGKRNHARVLLNFRLLFWAVLPPVGNLLRHPRFMQSLGSVIPAGVQLHTKQSGIFLSLRSVLPCRLAVVAHCLAVCAIYFVGNASNFNLFHCVLHSQNDSTCKMLAGINSNLSPNVLFHWHAHPCTGFAASEQGG